MSWGETRRVRLRALFARRDVTGRPDLPMLSVYRDYGVVPREGRDDNYNKPWEEFRHITVDLPPSTVQSRIADYLDHETARIDALIAAKQRMVELLEERRVAAAHATITGARLPGPRRSSPVAWLGPIPYHWQ